MSLLETLVVFAIVALLGALAYPRMEQAAQTALLRHAATVLTQDLRRTRAEALRSGHTAALEPAADGRRYLLPGRSQRQLPEGMILRGTGDIRFFADGSATGGRVTLAGAAGMLAVAVDPATGATSPVRP